MNRKDLVVGGEYTFSTSRSEGYSPHRCRVVDLEPVWSNVNWDHFSEFSLDKLAITKTRPWSRGEPAPYRKTNRISVEVEVVTRKSTPIDPETGEPWTDEDLDLLPGENNHWNRDRTKSLPVSSQWYPYAARAADLKRPWADHLEDIRKEEEQRKARYPLRVAHRQEQEAERIRKQEENERQYAQDKRERALREEFYETRIEPILRELEIEHSHSSHYSNGLVTFTYEELSKLLRKLSW